MADSDRFHEAPPNHESERRIELDLQEIVPVNENNEAHSSAKEDDTVFLSRAGGSYTTVPTGDTQFLASGEGPAIDAPEPEKGELLPQEPKEKLIVLRSWLLELLALLIGLLSFAGIIAILIASNKQAQLEFARDVNINTIIAILSTTLRAAMAFIATEVIGQSKWEWLETPRSLRHVERFDNAERGAWGSMKFLFFVSKPNFAVMGALLVVASYILDPFSQQLAKTYPCSIPSNETASLSVARRVGAYTVSERPLMWLAATTGLTGLSLSYSMAETSQSRLFQCPSGNCTFPMKSDITHTSVGLCSTCTDVSSDLIEIDLGNQSMAYQFPSQPNLNLTWPHAYDEISFRARTRNIFSSDWNDTSFSTTSIITFSTTVCSNHSETSRLYREKKCRKNESKSAYGEWEIGAHVGIVAVSCSLWPCLRRYRGEVSLGTLREELVSQELIGQGLINETLDKSPIREGYIKFEPCEVNGRWYDLSDITKAPADSNWVSWRDGEGGWNRAPKECLMGMDNVLVTMIAVFQHEAFKGDVRYSSWEMKSSAWLYTLAKFGTATFGSISACFDGMATGYTDFMRGDWEELKSERSKVNGTAWKNAVCIRADWPWLVYPAVLLVFTTTLLFAACVYSMREGGKRPVWKSTILPFLFYNLTMNRDQDRDPMDENGMHVPLLQLKGLEKLADQTVARFSSNIDTPESTVENSGTGKGGASAGQQVGLLRRRFKPRAG